MATPNEELQKDIQERCQKILDEIYIPAEPRHRLTARMVQYDIGGHSGALYIRAPQGVDEFEFYDYFNKYHFHAHLDYFDQENIPQLLEYYRNSLDSKKQLTAGWEKCSGAELEIQLGVRRTPRPPEEKIVEGLYYHDVFSESWKGVAPQLEFFSRGLAPHFKGQRAHDPLAWASERLEVALAYAHILTGRDYPFSAAAAPYTELAPLVCNTTPRCLLNPRRYDLTSKRAALLSSAKETVGEAWTPEAAVFLLENEVGFPAGKLPGGVIERFLKALPQILDNGLVIDRVTQLAQEHQVHGASSTEALEHACRMALAIYHRRDRPWWFKENFDLRPKGRQFGGPFSSEGRLLAEELAQTSGFAFDYARRVYERTAPLLENTAGLN